MAKLKAHVHKRSHTVVRKLRRPLRRSNIMHKTKQGHSFSRAKGRLTHSAENAYSGAQEMIMATGDVVMKRSGKALDKMEIYVKKQPLKAMGWAALGGMFVALLVKH